MKRVRITYTVAYNNVINSGYESNNIIAGNKNKAQFLDFLEGKAKNLKINFYTHRPLFFLKKVPLICFLCLLLNWSVHSQDFNLNQIKPLSGNPGRLIKLNETMRISDSQGGFFFRYPKRMNIGTNGDIFLMDYNQLLRFNQKGKMLNNYHREGQGSGELTSMKNYILYGDFIILCGNRPNKIIWFEKKWHLKKRIQDIQELLLTEITFI